MPKSRGMGSFFFIDDVKHVIVIKIEFKKQMRRK